VEIDQDKIEVSIYRYFESADKYYVKLDFGDISICGIVVQPSVKFPGEYMVNMPSYFSGNSWHKYIEFPKESIKRDLFEAIAIQAVSKYQIDRAAL